MTRIEWTPRARGDLASIRDYVSQGSSHYAALVVGRIIELADLLADFPQLGRVVPEIGRPDVRELVRRPYRVIYRVVSADEIHILTVHHAALGAPNISQR